MTAIRGPEFDRAWAPDSLTVTLLRADQFRASLRAVGDLDLTGAQLLSAMLAALRAEGRRFVRIDLSDIEFLDSAGMRALADEHTAFLRQRGTLVLSGLSSRARRLLQLVGLDQELLLLDAFAEVSPELSVAR